MRKSAWKIIGSLLCILVIISVGLLANHSIGFRHYAESGISGPSGKDGYALKEGNMKLTVLVDNNTLIDRYFFAEPGISLFIEQGGKRILFDVGYSDIFLKNAQKMNIDLRILDYVILSHGHFDHTWGLDPLVRLYTESQIENLHYKSPAVVGHPLVFLSKTIGGVKEAGSLISQDKLSQLFQIELSEDSVWLTERLLYLGQIERKNDFEAQKSLGSILKQDGAEPDYLLDDTALAYKSPQGLVIITGCSHSGICNIIEQAKRLCQEDRILDIVGGLHLLNPSQEQLQGTLAYMKNLSPKEMHACHCTDLNSKIALSRVVNLKEVGVGLILEYE